MDPSQFGQIVYDSVMRQRDKVKKLPEVDQRRVYEIVFDAYVQQKTGISGPDAVQAKIQFVNKMMGLVAKPIKTTEVQPQGIMQIAQNIAQRHPTASAFFSLGLLATVIIIIGKRVRALTTEKKQLIVLIVGATWI